MDIPTWIWFPLRESGKKGWSDEKQMLAEQIIKSLQEKARFRCWDLGKILEVNKFDDATPYGTKTQHKAK